MDTRENSALQVSQIKYFSTQYPYTIRCILIKVSFLKFAETDYMEETVLVFAH